MPTPMLLLHGFWHGAWCWTRVLLRLASIPRVAVAVDMAGHGLYARRPDSLYGRPFSAEALATERSPVADVDLDQAGELLLSQIKQLGRGGPVTVIAHSAGGAVLTRVAQQAPDLVAHAVYLAAYMPASGMPTAAYSQPGDLLSSCLRNDVLATGAARLDTTSPDPGYRGMLRELFYGDVDETTAEAAIALLGSDGPLAIGMGPAGSWSADPDVALTGGLELLQLADLDLDLDLRHGSTSCCPRLRRALGKTTRDR
jgi:pimeloyl-ACP methyl ester carboxylesterase